MATTLENFNALTDGDLNGQNSWSGSAEWDVEGTVTQEGAKAVSAVNNGGGGVITKTITGITSGIISNYLRATGATASAEVILRDGVTTKAEIHMTGGGTIILKADGSSTDTLVASYNADQWYFAEVEIDQAGSQVRGRIDGGAWTAWRAVAGFTSIDTLAISGGNGTGGVTGYIDTIVHTANSAGPANLKTFNGLAIASVKTINGLAIASVKSVNGLI